MRNSCHHDWTASSVQAASLSTRLHRTRYIARGCWLCSTWFCFDSYDSADRHCIPNTTGLLAIAARAVPSIGDQPHQAPFYPCIVWRFGDVPRGGDISRRAGTPWITLRRTTMETNTIIHQDRRALLPHAPPIVRMRTNPVLELGHSQTLQVHGTLGHCPRLRPSRNRRRAIKIISISRLA